MTELTAAHRRVLTEKVLKECWHKEFPYRSGHDDFQMYGCEKCDFKSLHPIENRTFLSGNDLIAVKEAVEKEGSLTGQYGFLLYAFRVFKKDYSNLDIGTIEDGIYLMFVNFDFIQWLLQPERFCYLAATWKMGEGKDAIKEVTVSGAVWERTDKGDCALKR